MRVISGTAKKMRLRTLDGLDTRPTTDRIKETLFNMLQFDLGDCYFLDLFSGSGAIGIEALSRGAKKAVFIEQNPKAIQCIKENLNVTKLSERAEVRQQDVLSGLKELEKSAVFDIIFIDPPYGNQLEKTVLDYLRTSKLAGAHTKIIIEAEVDTDFSYLPSYGYRLDKFKKYKNNAHAFVVKQF